MKCAIMQPTYLPWAGYFNLISKVDKFVFLDDVQFEKRSWQKRNKILLNGKEFLISIPVLKEKLDIHIKNVKIENQTNWRRDHWLTLQSAYSKAPFGKELLDILYEFYHDNYTELLAEFNVNIILKISSRLGINSSFYKASELNLDGKRSMHLVKILEYLNCTEYISPLGSADYLKEDNFEKLTKVKLTFNSFQPKPYRHYNCQEFIPRLSVVDVIANLGIEATKTYIL